MKNIVFIPAIDAGRGRHHFYDYSILFDSYRVERGLYFNGGFQIVNEKHKEFFEYVRNYYLENQHDVQNAISQVKAGTDQTIINFLLRKQNIELNYLSSCYNLQDLHSKQLLFIHPQMWFEDKLIFENCGYVFHFNAIPPNEMGRDANYWIKRTYEEFYK